jgi:hypothetical protein
VTRKEPKGRGGKIYEARSHERVDPRSEPVVTLREESSTRLVLTDRCFQALESGDASSLNLQVTSRGPVCVCVCVLIVQGLWKAQRANSAKEIEDPRPGGHKIPRREGGLCQKWYQSTHN